MSCKTRLKLGLTAMPSFYRSGARNIISAIFACTDFFVILTLVQSEPAKKGRNTPLKLNIFPLKNGWKMILSYWIPVTLQGGTVKLRGVLSQKRG